MTEKTARIQLREAVRQFAKAQHRPTALPDSFFDLEAAVGPGQALAELVVAYFDLGLHRIPGVIGLPTNELGLCRAVLIALGYDTSEIEGVRLNPRGRKIDAWWREVTVAALDGGLDSLKARDVAERAVAASERANR